MQLDYNTKLAVVTLEEENIDENDDNIHAHDIRMWVLSDCALNKDQVITVLSYQISR